MSEEDAIQTAVTSMEYDRIDLKKELTIPWLERAITQPLRRRRGGSMAEVVSSIVYISERAEISY